MGLRVLGLAFATLTFAGLFYVSRFWEFRLWARGEVFGLRPNGGYVGQWLRGTDFAPFELMIWAVGVFVVLSMIQKISAWLIKPKD